MKAFLNRLFRIALIPFGILFLYNGIGLVLISSKYPYPEKDLAVYLRSDTLQRGSKLIIGCSNLKHNINPDSLWKTHPEVDFLYFPANVNSTFMHYMGSLNPYNLYDTIIYYTPYSYVKKSNGVREGPKVDRAYTCGTYAWQTIRNNPINFFNNWLWRFINIKKQRVRSSSSPLFYLGIDTYMIHLRKSPDYAEGKLQFEHEKHIIEPVVFDKKDANAFSGIFPNKVVYIVFPAIPNIAENRSFIDECAESTQYFSKVLSKPRTEDSSLFYDQWFHMNGIGNTMETKRMVIHLDTLARCR